MRNEKLCKYCNCISPETNFRHNRLKCKDCEKLDGRNYRKSDFGKEKSKKWIENNSERMKELNSQWFQNNKAHINAKYNERYKNDPNFKFVCNQRRRIGLALEKKQKRTIHYLGCNSEKFFHWLKIHFNEIITFENHGSVWHVDHVIPLSKFNLEKEEEQILAFNWRNTMPLLINENLTKNNKINSLQIEQHYKTLLEYHKKNNIELPQKFIDLYAKYLVAGSSLEP
jgi:hypothetical protein